MLKVYQETPAPDHVPLIRNVALVCCSEAQNVAGVFRMVDVTPKSHRQVPVKALPIATRRSLEAGGAPQDNF